MLLTRRESLRAGAGVALASALGGCYGVGDNRTAGDRMFIWDIRTGDAQQAAKDKVAAYNERTRGSRADVLFFQNNPYKQKLQVAMGAGSPPDIFFGWGGGVLEAYVDAGDVYDLAPLMRERPEWGDRYLPQVLAGARFGDGVYGVPINGSQPVVLFYNREVFDRLRLRPPDTVDELRALIRPLRAEGLTPIALAGQSQWPYLMWEQYLVERTGGPDVVDAALAGERGAWSHPAFVRANTTIRELIDDGAFGDRYAALNYDSGQATALVYTGRAAMHLMGTWEYGSITSSAAHFVEQGKLGWLAFPEVEGGRGSRENLSGNLSNFYSVSARSSDPRAAAEFLRTQTLTREDAATFVEAGEIPPVRALDALLAEAEGEWLPFVGDLVQRARRFQLSWDQALPPAAGAELLISLSKLFLGQTDARGFSERMEDAASEMRA